jgi:hypothetical protein
MEHNHGNEYQLRIVCENGTEELSGWMNSIEQVDLAMILSYKTQGTTCWLLVRDTDSEQVFEYPIINSPSARYFPHDSRYLQVVESKNRYALGFTASRHTP